MTFGEKLKKKNKGKRQSRGIEETDKGGIFLEEIEKKQKTQKGFEL